MKTTPMIYNEEAGYPRFASRGRTFVYVLPCRDEDILKVGFSRNPLQRLHALHRRYFEFFDLDRALLVEVERLRDARRIERLMITRFAAYRAPPPLVVRQAAAGETEWFRGVADRVDALARQAAVDEGLILHAPLKRWLRERLDEHSDTLYGYANRMLDSIEYEVFNLPPDERAGCTASALHHLLDAYSAAGLDLPELVPARVLDWYRHCRL
ncbi:MAG: GIY-YIG nuclease family protein [Rhodanobacter sp.]